MQEAKIISGKDQQTFSPSVEKLHSVSQVHGEGQESEAECKE